MKVKLLTDEAKIPTRANISDAGFDLYCVENYEINYGHVMAIKTGIAVEIPFGCVGIIKDRSSKALEGLHILGGVIDSGYTGELIVVAIKLSSTGTPILINHNDKVAQLLILPLVPILNLELVDELYKSSRGNKGFGSSDDKSVHYHKVVDKITPCGKYVSTIKSGTDNLKYVTCPNCKELVEEKIFNAHTKFNPNK